MDVGHPWKVIDSEARCLTHAASFSLLKARKEITLADDESIEMVPINSNSCSDTKSLAVITFDYEDGPAAQYTSSHPHVTEHLLLNAFTRIRKTFNHKAIYDDIIQSYALFFKRTVQQMYPEKYVSITTMRKHAEVVFGDERSFSGWFAGFVKKGCE